MNLKAMRNSKKMGWIVVCGLLFNSFGVIADTVEMAKSVSEKEAQSLTLPVKAVPSNLQWQTNWSDPIFASTDARYGGTYHTYMNSFPQTFRTVGPDSNGSFASWNRYLSLSLLDKQPNTDNWIPALATSWAFGDDDKTVYFKLDPKAQWNDGTPVTAKDFSFVLTMMRSKDIVAPWYNDFYTKELTDVLVYDDHTIAVVAGKPHNRDELMDYVNLQPRPAHFYANPEKDENHDGIADDYIRRYNFLPEPVSGPYYIDKINKGRNISLRHVKDWWGYTNKYNQHRFNVEKINIKVIRDFDIAFKYFEKGQLDSFSLLRPNLWHDKAQGELFDHGYIQKAWIYNQTPVGAGGIWINTAKPLLGDINVRKGLMHAMDYDGMIKKVLSGDYVRKPNPMGVGHGDYDNTDIRAPVFDPTLAIQFFEQAGFTQFDHDGIRLNQKGQRLSFAVTYATNAHTPRIAYLREQAKLAGLDLDMNLVDGSSMFKYVLEKKHELSFHDMGSSSIPAYWEYFASVNANVPQSNNFTNYSSPELDALIEHYRNEFNIKKKHQYSRQIQQLISDANVIIPGYMVPYAREGFWRWMKLPEQIATKQTGFLFHDAGFSQTMSNFWIDEDVKEETKTAMKADKAFEPVTIIDKSLKIQ